MLMGDIEDMWLFGGEGGGYWPKTLCKFHTQKKEIMDGRGRSIKGDMLPFLNHESEDSHSMLSTLTKLIHTYIHQIFIFVFFSVI